MRSPAADEELKRLAKFSAMSNERFPIPAKKPLHAMSLGSVNVTRANICSGTNELLSSRLDLTATVGSGIFWNPLQP